MSRTGNKSTKLSFFLALHTIMSHLFLQIWLRFRLLHKKEFFLLVVHDKALKKAIL